MIRFKCPKCGKGLGLDDSQSGGVGTCPACHIKLRLPKTRSSLTQKPQFDPVRKPVEAIPTLEPVESEEILPRQLPGAGKHPRANIEEEKELAGRVDSEEEYIRPKKKKKRKKRRRDADQIPGLDRSLFIIIGAIAGFLLLGILSLVVPIMATITMALGYFISLLGGIWLLVVIYQESVGWAIACVFVPFVALIYVIAHWEDTKNPFFVNVAGAGLIFFGVMGGAKSLFG